jgi:hypothetical protein
MFRLLFVFSFVIVTNGKAISPWNISTTVEITSAFSTQTTPIETSTTTIFRAPVTTAFEYEEETTKATIKKNKSYEFQSNFSRNNDSVFVSLRSNASDIFISINNTFTGTINDPCEILFNEHSMNSKEIVNTKIFIKFNGSFTRDLATQLGDRFIDIVDLLSTVRSMANKTNTVESV